MVRYSYSRQVNPPAPFVHVKLARPTDKTDGLEIPTQVDTAADLSVIPIRYVEKLELVPLDYVSALGFGGHLLTLPTYLVVLQIRGLDAMTIKVLSSPDGPFALLGREVLNHYAILLDGPSLALEVR